MMASAADTLPVTANAADLRREAALHMAVGAVALAGGAAVLGQPSGQALQMSLVAVCLFLPIAAFVLTGIAAHHPHASFGLPNAVTTGRATLICLFGAGLTETGATHDTGLAWSLAALAAMALLMDGLDGYLARRLGLSSAFGARYDMEVDAVLILLLSIAAWILGKAGIWVLASGLIRYAFVAAGWIWPRLTAELPSSFRRKAVCAIQAAALCLLLAPPVQPPLSLWIAALALGLLAWSFAVDLAWLLRRKGDAPELAT